MYMLDTENFAVAVQVLLEQKACVIVTAAFGFVHVRTLQRTTTVVRTQFFLAFVQLLFFW